MFGQVQSGWHAQPDDEAGTTEGTTGAKPVSGAGGGTIGDWSPFAMGPTNPLLGAEGAV